MLRMGLVWPPENVFGEMAECRAKNRFLAVTQDLTSCFEWEVKFIVSDLHYFHVLL
jgi:hypothetical protein